MMIERIPELRKRSKPQMNGFSIDVFDASNDQYDFTQYNFVEVINQGFTSLSVYVNSDPYDLDENFLLFKQYLKEFIDSLSLRHIKQIWLNLNLDYKHNLILPIIFELIYQIKICKLEIILRTIYNTKNDIFIPKNISLFTNLNAFHLIVARDYGLTKGGTLHLSHEFYDLNLDFFYFEYYEEDRGQSEFDGFYRLICKEEDLKKIKKTEFAGLRKKFI
ncbi:MAG: hypothetical protein GPJ54_17400 [Candidatus Heimdallarchaeota archaeon]|nr:hypothetical protein [Candidatus Heimdallarchaeota archaeon]